MSINTMKTSMYMPEFFSRTPKEGSFAIEFEDKDSSLYMPKEIAAKVEVIGLSLSSPMREAEQQKFQCTICSAEEFTAIFGVASEKKSVKQVLTKEQKQDPWIFERLQPHLSFFYPSTFHKISKWMLTQFSNMALEDACAIVDTQTQMDKLSHVLALAQKRVKDAIYFASEEEANAYSEKIDQCVQAYIEARGPWLKTDEAKEVKKTEEQKKHLDDLKMKLKDAQEEIAKVKRSPLGQYHASRHIGDENPLVHMEAQKAQKILKAYCEKITETLTASGAEMSRTDLLEHIIGPKNFLFSHYGIVPFKHAVDGKKPFRFVPILQGTCVAEKRPHFAPGNALGFALNNRSPQDLENDIREQIRKRNSFLERKFPFNMRVEGIPRITDTSNREVKEYPNSNYLISEDALSSSFMQKMQELKNKKNEIYFSSQEEAQKWFEEHPLPQDFKNRKLSMRGIYYASQHVHSENPKIKMTALKAKKILKAYSEAIISTLKKGESHVYRKDLLEHIIGPKNFLFSHYGIVPLDSPSKPGYPFCFIPGAMNTCEYQQKMHVILDAVFSYQLENLGPKALEEEIRSDLVNITRGTLWFSIGELPVVIEDEEVTYPITSELQSLRDQLLQKLAVWETLKQTDKELAIQLILQFNGWDKYKIQPENIKLEMPTKEGGSRAAAAFQKIKGTLTFPGSKIYSIYFNTYDFLLIIEDNSRTRIHSARIIS